MISGECSTITNRVRKALLNGKTNWKIGLPDNCGRLSLTVIALPCLKTILLHKLLPAIFLALVIFMA
jgi:hypothetical protein